MLNAAERAADPDRYTSWKGQFPDLTQFYGQPWSGDNVAQAVDRSQDIQLAAGNGFRMGNGRINVSEPVNGRVYISDGLGSLSDADLIARTRAVLGQGNSATSARVNYLAAEAEATSNLYASGAGDVRTILTMQGSSGESLQRITAEPIESLPSFTAMSSWDSFLTFTPTGKLLSGVGSSIADLVQAPVVLAKEAVLTTSDTIGQSVTGALNWLTDSNLNYRSDSALYRSIQTNGVLGTVGLAVTGTVKGIVAPIDAMYRNDLNALGRSLPGTALAAAGPLAKLRSGVGAQGAPWVDFSRVDSVAPGFYRADPRQLRFTQATASPNFSTGGHTIASTADDLRLGRVTPEQLGDPLRVMMVDGKPFSFDNRRLVSYNLAEMDSVPIQVMGMEDAAFASKFFQRLDPIRGEGLQVVIAKSAEQKAAQQQLYELGLIKRKP